MFKYLFLFLIVANSLDAKGFKNSYISFDMPDGWHCKPEGGQHICQPVNPRKRKEAIVVMASKYKGKEDDLKLYFKKLKNRKDEIKDLKGKVFKSKQKYTKYNSIAGHVWVDSQHLSTEVPNFITRYLATVDKGVGIAITFSANKSKYKHYTTDFFKIIQSVKINDDIPSEDSLRTRGAAIPSKSIFGTPITDDAKRKGKKSKTSLDLGFGGEGSDDNTLLYIIIAGILLIFIIMRIRKR